MKRRRKRAATEGVLSAADGAALYQIILLRDVIGIGVSGHEALLTEPRPPARALGDAEIGRERAQGGVYAIDAPVEAERQLIERERAVCPGELDKDAVGIEDRLLLLQNGLIFADDRAACDGPI